MKVTQLFEAKPSAKQLMLRSIFTPENIVEKYDLVMSYLSKGMSPADYDELIAKATMTDMSQEELDFQYEMIIKALPKALHPYRGFTSRGPGGKKVDTIDFDTNTNEKLQGRHGIINRYYIAGHIFYTKGAWYVRGMWYDRNGTNMTKLEKKVKTPEEALALVQKPAQEVAARFAHKL